MSRLNQDAGEEEAEVTIIMNIFMIALSLFLSSMLILKPSGELTLTATLTAAAIADSRELRRLPIGMAVWG